MLMTAPIVNIKAKNTKDAIKPVAACGISLDFSCGFFSNSFIFIPPVSVLIIK